MNRETKRMMQRQGLAGEDGAPTRGKPRTVPSPNAPREPRTKPRTFVKEVNAELRKVAWPTRHETISYSVIVFIALVVLTAMIAGLDWVFSKGILWLVSK